MPSSIRIILGAAAAVAMLGAAGASAQPQPSPPNDHAPAAPDTNAPDSLSHRLSRSNGVIKPPPNVDPGMSAPVPTPHPHTTPVIPPPGTRGGKPDVQPK